MATRHSSPGGSSAAGKGRRKTKPNPPESAAYGPLPPDANPEYVPPPLPWHTGADLAPQEVRWLFNGYLPAGVPTLLYGPSKKGKSTALRALVAALTRGEDLDGKRCREPVPVVWLSGEEDYDSVTSPRLIAAGADPHLFHFPERLRGVARRKLRVLDHAREIQSVVERVRAGLIVLDPIRRFVGGGLDPESGQAADNVMAMLTDLGIFTGCAAAVIMHPKKGGRGAADEQVSGHQNWFNAARHCLKNVPYPGQPGHCALIVQGASLGPTPPALKWRVELVDDLPVCRFEGTCALTVEQAARGGEPAEEEQATEDAVSFLRLHLRDGAKQIKDLQRLGADAGLSIHQLRRARVKLLVTFRQVEAGETHAVEWCPPEGGWPS